MVDVRWIAMLAAGVLLAFNAPVCLASPPKPKAAAIATVAPSPPADAELPPRVYLFRGALGPLFSTGIDKLAARLTEAGLKADVYEFTLCRLVGDRVISNYREAPAPIVLIGQSMGGLCTLIVADMLGKETIPVSLVVTVDPAQASGKVPLNVERFINIFLSNSVLGGGDVVAQPGYRGHYASFDLRQNKRVTHINIEKSDDIHRQLVEMITHLPQVPNQTVGETVPLRYLVPADTSVELWDSGIRLPVRSGETLAQVGALYHLPLWSLSQANRLPDKAPLFAGQEIVIPRHLLPAEPAAAAVETPHR